ncbi:MAG: transcription elongation factor GreA [Christensenellaceae bacterium]|jgi:transcription elongation factor GreA|nr:transcription elongation factor GreA [Christensenellaceae bacterium]
MDGHIYVTTKGKKILEDRLAELISQREGVATKIREAREFGDLKENAEYAAAREEQANLEDEIATIKEKLPVLKMFSYAKADTSKVSIGSTVEIAEGTKKSQKWTITGVIENDPSNFYISNEAPLGKNLIGKKVGDTVEIHTPVGSHKYKIIKITAGA